jgi:hypothetical protein
MFIAYALRAKRNPFLLFAFISLGIFFSPAWGWTQSCPPPTGINAASLRSSSVVILWNSVSGATQYRVQWKSEGGVFAQSQLTNQNFLTLAGLQPNTPYEIEVQSICGSSTSRWSNPLLVTTLEASCNLRLQIGFQNESCLGCNDGEIRALGANGTPPYTYQIGGGSFSSQSTFSGLAPGSYVVTVRDANQCTASQTITLQPGACLPPTNIRVTQTTENSVSFSLSGGGNYWITYEERGERRSFSTRQNEFTILGLSPNTSYEFSFFSVCGSTFSRAQSVNAQTSAPGQNCPSLKTAPIASEPTTESLLIQWQPLESVQSYELSYKSQVENEWKSAITSQTRLKLTNLIGGALYEFRVRGLCAQGVSDYSPIGGASTLGSSGTLCNAPDILEFQLIANNTTAEISWTPVWGVEEYEFAYRYNNLSNWITQKVAAPRLSLENLLPGSTYLAKVRSFCGNIPSAYSREIAFFTPQSSVICVPPAATQIENLTSTSAKISWPPLAGISNYDFKYRRIGSEQWRTLLLSASTIELSNLEPGAQYEYQIRSFCGSGLSPFSNTFTFVTQNPSLCAAPGAPIESDISATSAVIGWSVSYGATGYELEWRQVNSPHWINVTVSSNRFLLNNLLPSTRYEARVRARCPDGTSAWTQSCAFTTRENNATQCQAPGIIRINNITHQSAIASWSHLQGISLFEVWYKPLASSTWQIMLSSTDRTANLQNLISGTEYELKARGICAGGFSYFSATFRFSTAGFPDCPQPNAPLITSLRAGEGVLSWPSAGGRVIEYELQYKRVSQTGWQIAKTRQTQITIEDVLSGQYYEFRLRNVCQGGFSAVSESAFGWIPFSAKQYAVTSESGNSFFAYPNPTAGKLQLQLPYPYGKLACINITGQKVYEAEIRLEAQAGEIILDFSHLPKGFYLLEYWSEGKPFYSKLQIAN